MGTTSTKTSQQAWQSAAGEDFLRLSSIGQSNPVAWIDSNRYPQGNLAGYSATVTISSAQILNMYTSPVLMVAPPSGFDITVTSLYAIYIAGTTAYSFGNPNDNVLVGFCLPPGNQATIYNGDYYQMGMAGFLDQTINNTQPVWIPVEGTGSINYAGSNLYMTAQDANPTEGNGKIILAISYNLIPIYH